MSAAGWALLISFVGAAGGIPGLLGIAAGIRKRRQQVEQTDIAREKLADENDKFVVQSAMQLLRPVNEELAKTRAECEQLREQVRELTAEVEHQRQIVNETTSKLELANKRADYWQSAFEARATE